MQELAVALDRTMIRTRIAQILNRNFWLLNLLIIGAVAYSAAGIVGDVLGHELRIVPERAESVSQSDQGVKSRAPSRVLFSQISQRNLFGTKRENLSPQEVVETSLEENLGESLGEFSEDQIEDCSLPITVKAIGRANRPEWSIVVIENNSTRETITYGFGEAVIFVEEGAELIEIRNEEIIVKRNGRYERCELNKSSKRSSGRALPRLSSSASERKGSNAKGENGVTQVSDTEYRLERREIDDVLNNLSRVATQARIVPSFKNGKANGFKIFSIKSKSIFKKIGLKNGDVIQNINGYEITSPDKALEIYQKLKDSSSITVDIQRRGRAQTMNYTIGS